MVASLNEMSAEFGPTEVHTKKQFVEVHCNIRKKNAADSLGVSLKKEGASGQMTIAKIDPQGYIAQQTQLSVGDVILAINNVGCTSFSTSSINDIRYEGLNVQQAAQLLKSTATISIRAYKPSSVRQRTILKAGPDVRIVEAVITRDNPAEESLGFLMGKHDNNGGLFVKKTVQGGLVTQQHTGLRPGYAILSINGVDCSSLTVAAAGRLCKTSTTLTIRAQKKTFAKDTVCRTTVFRTSTTPLGMTLRPGPLGTGFTFIKAIAHDSLVYHTGFQPGLRLLSVNDFDCQDKTIPEISQYLSSMPAGNVILRALV